MSPRARSLTLGLTVVGALLAAWLAADQARRAFIKRFFVDGPIAGSDPAWTVPAGATGLSPAPRVRVVLLDGLSAAAADALPAVAATCSKGQVLDLDVGFPTVSLPVQHALWTGLTQQQSGVQYRVTQLPAPPAHAIPLQVDSVAVAEAHPEIVHSFGFTSALPPADWKPDPPPTDPPPDPPPPPSSFPNWPEAFPGAALAAVRGPARLAFVHVLRIDEAGHKTGGASPEYAAAATWSDGQLATLLAAAPPDPTTRWFILADHAHRPAGGHGGEEPEIRQIRACVVGGVEPGPARAIHLVDLARAIADSLGVDLDPASRGRPWSAALADPAPDATLPTPGRVRLLLAALLLLASLLALRPPPLGPTSAQSRADALLAAALGLAWPLVGWLGLTLVAGWPTLSNPVVYPPQGRDMLVPAAPAMLLLGALALLAARRGWSVPRIAAVALAPWLAATIAVLLLAHAPELLAHGVPPLMPRYSAAVSVLLAQGRLACLVLACVLGLLLLRRARRGPS